MVVVQIGSLPDYLKRELGTFTEGATVVAALFSEDAITQLHLHTLLSYGCRSDIHREDRRWYTIRLLRSYADKQILITNRQATFPIGDEVEFLKGCIHRGWPRV
jgi:hypothetical protein